MGPGRGRTRARQHCTPLQTADAARRWSDTGWQLQNLQMANGSQSVTDTGTYSQHHRAGATPCAPGLSTSPPHTLSAMHLHTCREAWPLHEARLLPKRMQNLTLDNMFLQELPRVRPGQIVGICAGQQDACGYACRQLAPTCLHHPGGSTQPLSEHRRQTMALARQAVSQPSIT